MAISAELEVLKEKIRKMPAGKKRGDAQYRALLLWIPLQSDDEWMSFIKDKDGLLNGVEVASEVCASRNIWKTERFRNKLDSLNEMVQEKGLVDKVRPYAIKEMESPTKPVNSEHDVNPIAELAKVRLQTQLKRTEEKLHVATLRVSYLEKELRKYKDLSELNRALDGLRKQRV